MANRKAYENSNFEKGKSGNVAGRTPLPDSLTHIKKLGRVAMMTAMYEVVAMKSSDVEILADNPNEPAARVLMASCMKKGMEQGCVTRAQFFMNYLYGKPKEIDPTQDSDDDVKLEALTRAIEVVPSEVLHKLLREHMNVVKKNNEAGVI